jgi:nucleoside permease NupC
MIDIKNKECKKFKVSLVFCFEINILWNIVLKKMLYNILSYFKILGVEVAIKFSN